MISATDPQIHRSDLKAKRDSSLDVYNLLLALFLFVSPWMLGHASETAQIDLWVSGILIAAVSVAAIIAFSEWEEWLCLTLGIWLVSAPFVLDFEHTEAAHISVGAGGVVVFLVALELWIRHYRHEEL